MEKSLRWLNTNKRFSNLEGDGLKSIHYTQSLSVQIATYAPKLVGPIFNFEYCHYIKTLHNLLFHDVKLFSIQKPFVDAGLPALQLLGAHPMSAGCCASSSRVFQEEATSENSPRGPSSWIALVLTTAVSLAVLNWLHTTTCNSQFSFFTGRV